MNKFFSLRRKILILLMTISLLSGLTFLAISIATFRNDKIAYIFETNNSMISSISEQIINDISLASVNAKTILLKMQPDGKFLDIPDQKLNSAEVINGIEIYKIDASKNLKLFSSIAKDNVKKIDVKGNVLNTFLQKGKALEIKEDHIIIAESVKTDQETMAVFFYFKSKAMNTFFVEEKSYLSFLLDSSGNVIKADKSADAKYITENFLNSFHETKSLNSTTLKIKTPDKKNWLMTSVPLGYDDYHLVSMTDEDLAMSVLKGLTTKSILIFAIIFFIIVIVGVVTSNYLTSRLSQLAKATQKVIAGDYKFVLQSKGNDEITDLTDNFNQMTFEIVRLLGETAHKVRMEGELKTAKLVQETLFPKSETKYPDLHIKGHYISASECGGDWWYYSENPDSISIWIADATGHGASAALLTSAARSAVSLIEKMNLPPDIAMSFLNTAICSVSKENMMMTCFLGVFDKKTKVLKYVNASHEPPIIIKSKTEITNKDFIFLDDNVDPRLGESADSVFAVATVQLAAGDRIMFYTDGIPDIQNLQKKALGERGFYNILVNSFNQKLSFPEFADNFTAALAEYRQNCELHDDVTYCFTEIS